MIERLPISEERELVICHHGSWEPLYAEPWIDWVAMEGRREVIGKRCTDCPTFLMGFGMIASPHQRVELRACG